MARLEPQGRRLFERAREHTFKHAKLAAFGSTRRAKIGVEDDPSVQAMLTCGAPAAVVVGKSSPMQVRDVLRTTLDENLAMISETVTYLKGQGLEVLFDAEHFFDGYALDADYCLRTLYAASEAGADCLVLCDTNGGTLPGRGPADRRRGGRGVSPYHSGHSHP